MVSETDTDRLKCNADRFTAWTSESNVGMDRMYVSLPSIGFSQTEHQIPGINP